MLSTENTFVIKISKLISNFFNPLTSLFLFFLYYSWKHSNLEESLRTFLPIFLIAILPISIWIVYNVKTGKYSNVDVSNRNQRKSLYFFVAASLLIYLLYHYFSTGKIDVVMLFVMILLLIMQLSNYFIKSSMHTAFNVFAAALFFSENMSWGFIWLGISILVGLSRIILKRHTVKEVLMGFFIAALVSFIYLYVAIQMKAIL